MSKVLLPEGSLLHNGAYRVERQLSSGGFGNTYVVTKTASNDTFALKEFFIRGVNTREGGVVTVSVDDNRGTFQSQRRKFVNEALRLHGLNHPNIVHVTDLFEENGTSYYVMDYIEGMSLKEYMQQRKSPIPEKEVRNILDQLLDALDYLHAQQPALLHLDIKPANIMLTKEGKVKLIDFGASKQVSQEDDLHHTLSTMCYTPGYAPPEQMEQITEMIGPWSDFYAVGATLYTLLIYKSPPSYTALTSLKEKAFHFPETISVGMRRLIAWMMNPDVAKRPQRVGDIKAFLEKTGKPVAPPSPNSDGVTVKVIGEAPPNGGKPRGGKAPVQSSKSNRWMYYAAAILAALVIGVIWRKMAVVPPMKASKIKVEMDIVKVNGATFNMVRVKGGTFTMGATSEQGSEIEADEKPAHKVTLSDYYIGETEVTQSLWQAVMGTNPSKFRGGNLPVEQVSWNDCQLFVRKLSSLTGRRFRLPTEAEWEYAARGGRKNRNARYAGSSRLDAVAWYDDNSGGKTHPVKTKTPNELGLYDMSGNVYEWTSGWYGNDYASSAKKNPQGPASGSNRVNRGGSCNSASKFCRVANRNKDVPNDYFQNLGLRLVY